MEAFVYALRGSPETLQAVRGALGKPLCHWVANPARLIVGQGLPEDWKEQGALFGPKGELRWWRTEEGYRALLLTEASIEGLAPLPGNWKAEETHVFLQSLQEPRVRPNFPAYPYGQEKGRLRVYVYYREGVPTFVSPREFL